MESQPIEGAEGPGITAIGQMAMDMVLMMNGEIDFAGLPVLAAMQGVEDLDTLLPLMVIVRDRFPKPSL